jgi:preprotein translocase subunit YajC
MFITPAFAQAATDTASSPFGSGFEMIILFVPLMVVWYFLLIRPQRAQAKKRDEDA